MSRKIRRSSSSKSLRLRSRAAAPLLPGVKLHLKTRTVRQVEAVCLLTVAILLVLALRGQLGQIGSGLNFLLTRMVGYGAWFVPALLVIFAGIISLVPDVRPTAAKVVGLSIATVATLGLIHLTLGVGEILPAAARGEFGGYIGFTLNVLLRSVLGDIGTGVVLTAVLIIGLIMTFEVSPLRLITFIHWLTRSEEAVSEPVPVRKTIPAETEKLAVPRILPAPADDRKHSITDLAPAAKVPTATPRAEPKPAMTIGVNKPAAPSAFRSPWKKLSLDLLQTASGELKADEAEIAQTKQTIRETLLQFGIINEIEARGEADPSTLKPMIDTHTKLPRGILEVHHQLGPTVTQFAFTPPEGVKLSKITSLDRDFALKLRALSLRIEAPIPGQDRVGIELPNSNRAAVGLREVMESPSFDGIQSNLRIPLGKNVSNVPVSTNLKTMPHLLIAGATGSGKSVMVNAILISFLYQNSPDDLKLLLVDPKRVELTGYNGIPHLLAPVITDPEKTVMALRWAVAEMTRRYKTLESSGDRNIDEYNHGHADERMPYIVIVIDELADLMLVAAKEVEASICRIAQMARAVGIHLIVATQRPSVDVVTGLIKANIPSRIAFTVASGIDSRTIIDTVGAEKLLGQGDMLFLDRNVGRLQRIQGVYISPKEIKRVVSEIKLQSEPAAYNDEITDPRGVGGVFTEGGGGMGGDMGSDSMEEQAITLILETGKASASLLQRHLQVGYARAARILDILEAKGYIGPADGAKPRKILRGRDEEAGE